MIYRWGIRPILFPLTRHDPEIAARIIINAAKLIQRSRLLLFLIGLINQARRNPHPVTVFGLQFPNPIGLAAGVDKHGEMVPFLERLGLGFVEVGTVTSKPQVGNDRPRMARLPKLGMLLNWLGFNSDGLEVVHERLWKVRPQVRIPVGGNVGKQFDTALKDAALDYVNGVLSLRTVVDYLVINLSSPNTPELRQLQTKAYLEQLLRLVVQTEQDAASHATDPADRKVRPILLKIDPDLSPTDRKDVVEVAERVGVAGLIISNTTVDHPNVVRMLYPNARNVKRGLSGGDYVFEKMMAAARHIRQLSPSFPLILVGGIDSPEKARQALEIGNLIQIHTGFVYQGARLVKKLRHVAEQMAHLHHVPHSAPLPSPAE